MILAIISIILIVLGFRFPKSRKLTVLMLIFMWILYGFNDANGDYVAYYYDYLKIGRGDFYSFSFSEEGYIALAYLCGKFLHVSYQQFIIFTSALSTVALGYVVKEYTPQPNTVLALFMLNPYWMMICQTRFYMAFLLVCIGYVMLAKYDSKKGDILFILLIILSGFFHRTGWLCMMLLLARLKNRKIIGGVMVFVAFLITLFRTSTGMRIAGRYLDENKVELWLAVDAHRSTFGVFLIVTIHILLLFAAYYMYRRLEGAIRERSNSYKFDATTEDRSKALCLFMGIVLMMAFLPMECIDKNYERLFRYCLFFVYCLFGYFREYYPSRLKAMPLGTIMMSGAICMYYAFFYVSFSGWFEHNLVPILNSNLLLP